MLPFLQRFASEGNALLHQQFKLSQYPNSSFFCFSQKERYLRLLAYTLCLMLLPVLCAAAQTTPASSPLPDGPGKDTFASVCSLCHDNTVPMSKHFTRNEWELKIIEMLQEEPDVTREERAAILEYATANFKPGGKIYINYTVSKDLQTVLGISAGEAEAIVRHRQTQGLFKTIDDIKKVSGVNASKIDAVRDRLVF
jgi:competence protein ComEA